MSVTFARNPANVLPDLLQEVTMTWLSDAAGAATDTTDWTVSGALLRVVHIPDSGGTQPTNSYDVTLTDEDGVTIFTNTAVSNAAASEQFPGGTLTDATNNAPTPKVVKGPLTLTIANAGNAKGGKVKLFFR
jgi:hypothetical protein